AKPEVCSLNMGSMNFGLFPMLDRYKEWKHDWEPKHLENSRDFIFRNTFKDIEEVLKSLGEGCGTKFEFECYDVGHLYTLAHFLDRRLVKSNAEQVRRIRGILENLSLEVANATEARDILNLKGGDRVAF